MYLLFERLCEEPPEISISGLRDAVREQIQRLVITQVVCRSDLDPELMNMGIPSVSRMARGSGEQMAFWALRLEALIRRFEPRLDLLSVELEATGNVYEPLRVLVEGQLKLGDEIDTMSFSIDLVRD